MSVEKSTSHNEGSGYYKAWEEELQLNVKSIEAGAWVGEAKLRCLICALSGMPDIPGRPPRSRAPPPWSAPVAMPVRCRRAQFGEVGSCPCPSPGVVTGRQRASLSPASLCALRCVRACRLAR